MSIDINAYLKEQEEKESKMKLKLVDVYGEGYPSKNHGMCVAVAFQKCPIFNGVLDSKMHTIVFNPEDETEVKYWIHHIGGSIVNRKQLDNGKIAIREQYNYSIYG